MHAFDRAADLASRDPPWPLDREFAVTRRYAEAVGEVAREERVGFVDVWNRIWEAAGREEDNLRRFLVDGLHLNAEGYAVSVIIFFAFREYILTWLFVDRV